MFDLAQLDFNKHYQAGCHPERPAMRRSRALESREISLREKFNYIFVSFDSFKRKN